MNIVSTLKNKLNKENNTHVREQILLDSIEKLEDQIDEMNEYMRERGWI